MIVRITDMGHYDIPREFEDEVLMLDLALDASMTPGNDEAFDEALKAVTASILEHGVLLTETAHLGAELVIPAPGSSLTETRLLLDSEAFEC